MYEPDMEVISFVIDRDYYKVMPFRLKNRKATYQRLINRIFKEKIGDTMEVYVDDMVVKSKEKKDYIKHLQELFDLHWKYNMKLNREKNAPSEENS